MNRILISLCFFLLSNVALEAHESRPLFIKIESDNTFFAFEVNLPNTVDKRNLPKIYLNDIFVNEEQAWVENASGVKQKWRTHNEGILLKGSTLRIEYPTFNPVLSTIVALRIAGGEEEILLMPPNQSEVVIPKSIDRIEVRKQYAILGIEHIWAGVDHLLFIVCLLIITGFTRKLFITITGFTIAHSITLALAALEFISLPIPPIEATIALSIVFLCYEIIHHHEKKDSLTYRYPIVVASSFGLLHGLGFAAVLGEIGLPKNHTIESLLFFYVGVEIGQVLFVLLLFILFVLLRWSARHLFSNVTIGRISLIGLRSAMYIIGVLASYWMFDRIL